MISAYDVMPLARPGVICRNRKVAPIIRTEQRKTAAEEVRRGPDSELQVDSGLQTVTSVKITSKSITNSGEGW